MLSSFNNPVHRKAPDSTQNVHELKWSDGITDYLGLGIILKSRCKNEKIVLIKGSEKKRFLENLLSDHCVRRRQRLTKNFRSNGNTRPFRRMPFPRSQLFSMCKEKRTKNKRIGAKRKRHFSIVIFFFSIKKAQLFSIKLVQKTKDIFRL